jgi:hypothetical protein
VLADFWVWQFIPSGRRTFAGRGPKAVEAVGMVWVRDMISQTGVVKDDASRLDSDFPTKLGDAWRADVDCFTRLHHRPNSLSDRSAAIIATDKSAG